LVLAEQIQTAELRDQLEQTAITASQILETPFSVGDGADLQALPAKLHITIIRGRSQGIKPREHANKPLEIVRYDRRMAHADSE
jgi:hypothetical protein